MKVVISICAHELEMARNWFDWLIELGGTDNHSLYMIPSKGTDIKDIVPKADKAFGNRTNYIVDYDGVTSDWQRSEPARSAAGPNSAFRQIAWHFYMNKLGPFMWCELDCIPTKKDWLDRIEAEYKVGVSKGKPFMGARVLLETVPEHMSGNGVYPQNVPEVGGSLVTTTQWTSDGQQIPMVLAFDVAGAREIVPKAHWTNLIQHIFRHPGFKSREEFDSVIDKDAVMFHSCKDGSIYKYLRENLSGSKELRPVRDTSEGGESPTCCGLGNRHEESAPAQNNLTIYGVGEGVVPIGGHRGPIDAGLTISNRTTVKSKTFGSDELHKAMAELESQSSNMPPLRPPWEDREESEREVRTLCAALALFCKAPVYKARVRNALREAKIIK
jgi:hypothetical protein